MKFLVTTPIYYPNDVPHMGHAYTTIAADIIARWERLKGNDVFFLTGTDENSIKVVQAAKERNIESVKKYVDEISEKFKYAWKVLNISYDDFIRTTEERHKKRVYEVLERVKKEDIYKGYYEGFYCEGCETFLLESELENGICPVHKKEPKFLREENYFFKLSNYEEEILRILEGDFVYPESRKNEMINFVKSGLRDISISRPGLKWGIDFPLDKEHKVWVWFDALVNYLQPINYWPASLHLIGKDILRFHAVIWPAMLISAGYDLPKKIFAHGFFTVNGQKMSKSLGNVIDPIYLCERYGEDAIRYYLIREIPFGEDGSFSESSLINRINNELVANFSNLFYRVTLFCERNLGVVKKEGNEGEKEILLKEKIKITKKEVDKLIEEVKLTDALARIMDLSSEINKYFQEKEPWKKLKIGDEESRKDINLTVYTSINALYSLCVLLYPFIPRTCEIAVNSLGRKLEWNFEEFKIEGKVEPKILFKKIEG